MTTETSFPHKNADDGVPSSGGRFSAVKRRLPTIGLTTLSIAALGLAFVSLRVGVSQENRLSYVEKQQNVVYTQALAKTDLEPLQANINMQAEAIKRQQVQLDAVRKSLEAWSAKGLSEAVAQVRHSIDELNDSQTALQSRQAALEQSVTTLQNPPQKAQQDTAEPKAAAPVKKPAPAKPHRAVNIVAHKAPFVLTGVEKRGTESFAAIAPSGFSSLAEIRLIGEGQTVNGWTLIHASYGQAQFRVNGRLTTINVR
ncbi:MULTISPECIES: DUF2275 domain-containing protein [Enterobacterales]|uniref:DUF2275 domain-containing protein n=1 Tax=Chimaeribacter coloradensis TaxID=2060068 RepID=A0A2N5DTJ1_9GAMM|nr:MULTISPECIES: DUF2275 domain-containing protein [Enterobacterales]PLR29838.1 DUF2275 domain-containing protein [Chimaeribacter coloradensis]